MYSVDCCPKGLVIGKQGENEAEKVVVDFSPWASEFGAGTISARLRRPKDSAAYPVVLTTEGTTATWTVSATDTQYAGAGSLQLVYIVGDVVAKSVIWPVRVLPSLEEGEAPEPYESWLDTLEGLAADTQENARDAAASAADASASAEDAAQSAQSAAESAASITGLTAVAETLPEGSEASASFDSATDTLTLGIPRGDTGATGPAGPAGPKGDTGADGFSPSASVTKTDGNITITITDKDGTTSETLEVDDALDDTSENPVENQAIQNALWNMLPVDTASGAIASFPDGADDVPMLSLKAQIEPVQDLHGYDSPWPAGGGKNIFTCYDKTVEMAGLIIVMKSHYIEITGTCTASKNINLTSGTNPQPGHLLESGAQYTWSAKTEGTIPDTLSIYGGYYGDAVSQTKAFCPTGSQTRTIPSEGTFYDRVWMAVHEGEVFNGTLYIQTEKGSAKTAYAPWENVCPISGHTGVTVEHTGVNVWDEEVEGGVLNSDGTVAASNSRLITKNYIPIVPGKTYAVVIPYSGRGRGAFYDENHVFLSYFGDFPVSGQSAVFPNDGTIYQSGNRYYFTFIAPSGAYYVKYNIISGYGVTYNHDISINYPSTDHDYHAYHGESIPVSWESEAGTVYGGELDVVSGELTVTHGNIASYNGETLPSTWISDRDVYASGTTPTTGAQVVYELATPQTYQLTPQEVKTYLGQNNLWNDVGDTEVTYRADIAKYIEKKVTS